MPSRGKRIGKYRIGRRLAEGGFAEVFRARDTVEGIDIALKIPHRHLMTSHAIEDFRAEARITARLDHPNILPIKNADTIDGTFVIAYPLGERTLEDRLRSRISRKTAVHYAEQMLTALAYAHARRVVHCDVKPENFILFSGDRLRLTDFGIAKLAMRTVEASGSGTVGYVAPEQAMGKPSARSDVFSAGLILYRMFSGILPEWPFEWPPPGAERLRGKIPPDVIRLLRRAIEINPRRRFPDAGGMEEAFLRLKSRLLAGNGSRRRRKKRPRTKDWREVRHREFRKRFGRGIEARHDCAACGGPVSESMLHCPWCGKRRRRHRGGTRFPRRCPRCHRGMKSDWRFCPWCFGPGFEPETDRSYRDVRYVARCSNSGCSRKDLMPFMRYCPWCRQKVRKRWKVSGTEDRCPGCGWGVAGEFWENCPWCARNLDRR